MAQIFISYSRADRQFAEQLVPLVRKVYGNDGVWFDDDIHGGADWWQMILAEVGKCTLFVYLVSNESLESPYCQAELREALRLGKPILPVIVRRLNPAYPGNIADDIAPVLRKTQYVDLSGDFRDPNTLTALYAAMTRLLSSPSPTTTPATTAPTPQPMVPDKNKRDATLRSAYVVGGFALIAVIIAGVFGAWQGLFANREAPVTEMRAALLALPDATPSLTIALTLSNTLEPSLTPTPTATATFTATLTQTPTPTATMTETALPTAIPTNTSAPPPATLASPSPTASVPAVVRTFPCDATIRGSATVLRIVYNVPHSRGIIVRTLRNGDAVRLLDTVLEAERTRWYQIAKQDTAPLGWVLSDYIRLSDNCANE